MSYSITGKSYHILSDLSNADADFISQDLRLKCRSKVAKRGKKQPRSSRGAVDEGD
jgi:hypothetical protein